MQSHPARRLKHSLPTAELAFVGRRSPLHIHWEYINEDAVVDVQPLRHDLREGRPGVPQLASEPVVQRLASVVLQKTPVRQQSGCHTAEALVVGAGKRHVYVVVPRDEAAVLDGAQCASADHVVGQPLPLADREKLPEQFEFHCL